MSNIHCIIEIIITIIIIIIIASLILHTKYVTD